MRIWQRLRKELDCHGKVAMVTLVATKGSAPREAGARLLVNPDGTFTGTIGGGALEWRAIALARSALANPTAARAEMQSFVLGPRLGQCCGGQVELIVELIGDEESAMVNNLAAREAAGMFVTSASVSTERGVSREVVGDMKSPPGSAAWFDGALIEGFGDDFRPLHLFGAGHVGRAVVLSLAQLPFAVTWIDSRPDAFPTHVPANVVAKCVDDPVAAIQDAPIGSFVLIMSHSHPLDLALVGAALSDQRFDYIGLIGSRSKRARFTKRLEDAGIAPTRLSALVCPIGVDGIRSKAPAIIATATAAELLIHDEALRAARADPAEHYLAPIRSAFG